MDADQTFSLKSDESAEPARPILGSHLLELEEKQRNRFANSEPGQRVKTGCTEIDDLLGGGFERGILVGISADGAIGRLISLHLLASVLIFRLSPVATEAPSKAIVVDTTGSFPLAVLAEILTSRIKAAQDQSDRNANQTANHQSTQRSREKQPRSNVNDDVQRCLEMVALSRVFDIEGLWEVLGEVGRQAGSNITDDVETVKRAPSKESRKQSFEIYDSQDEDASSDEEDTNSFAAASNQILDQQGTEIIVVDNMAHIINEMFARKEKNEAHTLLTLLSQSIRTLSSTQNILTILHNNTVSSKSYNAAPAQPESNKYIPPSLQKSYQAPALPSSIFASNPLKPALGQLFAPFPMLHLFLSTLPKSRADIDNVYGRSGHDNESASLDSREVEYCTVLEVLKDETPILGTDKEKGRKFGWREQKWTALEVDSAGIGFVGTFQVKGNMRGMAMDREKVGGLTDVGRMAKVHGFGGRRM